MKSQRTFVSSRAVWLTRFCLLATAVTCVRADLIGYWKFEGGVAGTQASGTVRDLSPTRADGAIIGSPRWAVPAAPSGSSIGLEFTAMGQGVFVPDRPEFRLTNRITIDAYVRPNGPSYSSDWASILFRGDNQGGHDPYHLGLRRLTVVFLITGLGPGGEELKSEVFGPQLTPGQNYRITAQFDGSTGRQSIWVNGVLAGMLATSIRPFADLTWFGPPGLGLGSIQDPLYCCEGHTFNGTIDEIRLFNSLEMPEPGPSAELTVTIPGTSDLWLAGMPNGAHASVSDTAPAQAPVGLTGLLPGSPLTFTATGLVGNCPDLYDMGCPAFGPDGGTPYFHETGAENGLSDIGSPINALIGVFLADDTPSTTAAPERLDFNAAASRNYLTLSPKLKQMFFIGNGLTEEGVTQQVIVPTGATRLFLGTLDGCCWDNNSGHFLVKITAESGLSPLPITGQLGPTITPLVTGSQGANGWYRSEVTVAWRVEDRQSGIASSTGCSTTRLTTDTTATTLTCSATNTAGLSRSVSVTIKIDRTAPVVSGLPAAGCTLTPPDHRLTSVATVSASDGTSGLATFNVTATSNEPANGTGSGDLQPDIVIGGTGLMPRTVQLRAEAAPAGSGRTYALTGTATDQAGNSTAATASCTVAAPPLTCAANVTAQFTISRSGFRLNNVTRRFLQTLTITRNSTGAPLSGPFAVALDSLSPNATLYQPAGTTGCGLPAGSPYVVLNPGPTWSSGQSLTVNTEFVNPTNAGITYTTRLLAGSTMR